MFQQRCVTLKQEDWLEKICDKLNRESNDGESDHEEARVSRPSFDLFEQTDIAEKAVTGTERAEQGGEQRWTNPSPERDELEQAQSTISCLNNLPMQTKFSDPG